MKIHSFKKKETEPYIPVWEGQRTRARTDQHFEPIALHIRSMTWGDSQRWMQKALSNIDTVTGSFNKIDQMLSDEIFKEYVTEIEYLEDGDGKKITTPDALLNLRETQSEDVGISANVEALINEVISAIRDRSILEKGLRKNFPSSSDFGPTKKPETSGVTS